jgi:hypothetical protein
VRVPQAAQRAAEAATREVRRVRIALGVGALVVAAVHGDPVGERPLRGHRAQHRQAPRTARGATKQPCVKWRW